MPYSGFNYAGLLPQFKEKRKEKKAKTSLSLGVRVWPRFSLSCLTSGDAEVGRIPSLAEEKCFPNRLECLLKVTLPVTPCSFL